MQIKENNNIDKLKELVNELTIRDEQIFREHNIFEKIVNLVMDGIWIVDIDNHTIYSNDKLSAMIGYTQNELMNKNIYDFILEEDRVIAKKYIEKRKIDVEPYFFRFITKEEGLLLTHISVAPLYSTINKKYRGAIIYLKQIDNKLLMDYHKKMFLELMFDPFIMVDFNGIIQDTNENYRQMLKYESKNNIIGKHYSLFVQKDYNEPSKKAFETLLKGQELSEFQNQLICADNEVINVSWRCRPNLDSKMIFASAKKI